MNRNKLKRLFVHIFYLSTVFVMVVGGGLLLIGDLHLPWTLDQVSGIVILLFTLHWLDDYSSVLKKLRS